MQDNPLLASSSGHILIVDDNPDELRLLIEMLRGSRYRLSVAFDGVQGYNRAVAGKPDLILLDVCMPRMSGFAMCARLKATPDTAEIPIIFLSSGKDLDQRLQGLNSGACDYIIKPFAVEEVLARVRIHMKPALSAVPVTANESVAPLNADAVLVGAAKRHLAGCVANPPSLERLAHMLGTNEKRLSMAFRQCIGMTVFEYLRSERMHIARRLLAETTLSVVAISEEVGFSRAANFSTAFQAHTGQSPSVFRRTARTDGSASHQAQ